MSKACRILAALTVAALIAVILMSSLLAAHHEHHHCTGEECLCCEAVRTVVRVLRRTAAIVLALSFMASARSDGFESRVRDGQAFSPCTLVSLKVRLTS